MKSGEAKGRHVRRREVRIKEESKKDQRKIKEESKTNQRRIRGIRDDGSLILSLIRDNFELESFTA